MSDDRLTYVDSSALVKVGVREPESLALGRYLRRRTLVASALARTEVTRALGILGAPGLQRADEVLERVQLVRISDRVLRAAGLVRPTDVRSLDAIHLATALIFGPTLQVLVTYDARMAAAAKALGIRTHSPT